MHGRDEHLDVRVESLELFDQLDPILAPERNVHNRRVRTIHFDDTQRTRDVDCLSADLQVGLPGNQLTESMSDDRMIVDNQNLELASLGFIHFADSRLHFVEWHR